VNAPPYVVRRATVDDLGGLKALWERASLQVLELERRLTEFQLIVRDGGEVLGAVALQLAGKQGLLHSEAFAQPEHEDELRPRLWERLQTVARNHGLVRLWTQEQSPFWHQAGFIEADLELQKKLPTGFGNAHQRWWTLQLKEETAGALSIEQEFELFQQAQKAGTEQMLAQAHKLKTVAYVIAVVVLVFTVVAGLYVARTIWRGAPPAPGAQPP
jgi:N-acetylglutamate synthase-like GNAT family acetyltransferase